MSTPSPGSVEPPPPGSAAPRSTRRRPALVAAVTLGSVAVVTVLALGADALWRGGAEGAKTSTAISSSTMTEEPPSSPPPADPTPPADLDVDYTVEPALAWQVSATTLMSGAPEATVVLAAPDPLDRPNHQETVVVTVETGTASAVMGLDRATGSVTWQVDLADKTSVDCHVLGAGASTVCVATDEHLDAESYLVLTLETSTGDSQGADNITFKPWTVTEVDDDIVLAGNALLTGALHMTRGTASDVDARWQASSADGYVPPTGYYGGFRVSESTAWSYVSGATMIVDLATGQAESMSAESGQLSEPWPGGTILDSTTQADGSGVVTATPPDAAPFLGDGHAWARLGSSKEMETYVGIGDTAHDLVTGVGLWSGVPDPTALATTYTAVDDLVLQQTWWEESVSLLALDARTGLPRWSSGTRSAMLLSRVDDVLITDTSFGIEALDLSTGRNLWAVDYTDLMTQDPYTYTVEHSIAGPSLVTTFDRTVTGYSFD